MIVVRSVETPSLSRVVIDLSQPDLYPADRMRRAAAIALGLALLSHGAHASAQSALGDARSRYVQGDFRGTLESADRAEAESSLTTGELLAVLELRALAQRALGDETAADRTLRVIAAIDPEHTLGAEVPPVLRERFASLAASSVGPPRIATELLAADDGATLRITADAEDDPEQIVRRIALRARIDGGPWESADAGSLTLAVQPGARVEWEASAHGPGGAAIASARGEHVVETEGVSPWPFVGIGIGVAVVGVVIGVIVGTIGVGVDTDVEGPIVASLRF